jgi:NAD(P)H-dependent FMN reductase
MGDLPQFNPDLDGEGAKAPREVAVLRELVERADALVISTPEYAHGLPGSFKNLLDWLVSFPPFAGKPVIILHVARGSTWALDSLREVLRTMSARMIEEASVSLPLGTNQMDEAGILGRDDLRDLLERSVETLLAAHAASAQQQA